VTGATEAAGSLGHQGGEGEGLDATVLPSGALHGLVIDANLRQVWLVHLDVPAGVAPAPPTMSPPASGAPLPPAGRLPATGGLTAGGIGGALLAGALALSALRMSFSFSDIPGAERRRRAPGDSGHD